MYLLCSVGQSVNAIYLAEAVTGDGSFNSIKLYVGVFQGDNLASLFCDNVTNYIMSIIVTVDPFRRITLKKEIKTRSGLIKQHWDYRTDLDYAELVVQ
jgi:hypothetical protein